MAQNTSSNNASAALLLNVLESGELAKAGQLFNTSDYEIVGDLANIFTILKRILKSTEFQNNANTQCVLEICLARITSAIR
jgi:hypothetical protein